MARFTMAACVFVLSLSTTAAGQDPPAFDVPRMANIAIDGDDADWGDRGFRVEVLADEDGQILAPDDFDARFRLGWNRRGLLVLVEVEDDRHVEHAAEDRLWEGDSIELFVAPRRGESDCVQAVIAPGLDPDHPKLRHRLHDHRGQTDPKRPTIQAGRQRTKTSCVLEFLLSWQNLGVDPKAGTEIGCQLHANDADGQGRKLSAKWSLRSETGDPLVGMHGLRLWTDAGPPIRAAVRASGNTFLRTKVAVITRRDLAGKTVEAKGSGQVLGRGKLAARAGRAHATLRLPMPTPGRPSGAVSLCVDGEYVAAVIRPDADEQRARQRIRSEVHFRPCIFSGSKFPECEFEHPSQAELVFGPHEIKTTFYDGSYKRVTSAAQPGRYGAVVEIVPDTGPVTRRFRTLFRGTGRFDPRDPWLLWHGTRGWSIELPQALGIDPRALQDNAKTVSTKVKWCFSDAFSRDPSTAALLAGLYEDKPGGAEPTPANDVWAQDRQWWVGLKRKLYGAGALWPEPFVCPRPVKGEPAPVLREGTCAQAGMKKDAAKKIDEVCRAWAADSDQGFAVCVARRGVVFFHKAYGQRNGKPMTVTTQSWMASITKLLSASLMMMLVDRGLVDLDDPVSKFLPPFRGVDVETPLTIRHLYTHTNGLWGHWGDDRHDLAEAVADYYPYLKIAQRFRYNGAGFALGGKIIEAVSGEAIPQFYQKHLLGPLGCSHTEVAGTMSVPMDMARIGQMLLNRGAYGKMRFFGDQTLSKMLPRRLTGILGPDTGKEYGIGTMPFRGEGLGEGTFAHGAASSATLRIDPVNEMVIVMTRNGAGKNFLKYHPKFIATIAGSLSE